MNRGLFEKEIEILQTAVSLTKIDLVNLAGVPRENGMCMTLLPDGVSFHSIKLANVF